jgi:hypothetical protein
LGVNVSRLWPLSRDSSSVFTSRDRLALRWPAGCSKHYVFCRVRKAVLRIVWRGVRRAPGTVRRESRATCAISGPRIALLAADWPLVTRGGNRAAALGLCDASSLLPPRPSGCSPARIDCSWRLPVHRRRHPGSQASDLPVTNPALADQLAGARLFSATGQV